MANISDRDIELLSKKLSHLSSSAFPRKLWQAEVEPSVGTKEAYLTSLLKRDIPVFLGCFKKTSAVNDFTFKRKYLSFL